MLDLCKLMHMYRVKTMRAADTLLPSATAFNSNIGLLCSLGGIYEVDQN